MPSTELPSPPTPMRRRGKVEGGVTVLLVPGPDLCGRVAEQFECEATLACRLARRLVIDMEAVTRIDPAGLRTVVTLAKSCRNQGGVVKVCASERSVRILLALAEIPALAEVFHTRRQAIFAASIVE